MTIISGNIGRDYVHLLISYPPTLDPSKIVQYLKGRSSRMLQDEFPELKKKYWGQHLWARGEFYETIGSVNEETIKRYIFLLRLTYTFCELEVSGKNIGLA